MCELCGNFARNASGATNITRTRRTYCLLLPKAWTVLRAIWRDVADTRTAGEVVVDVDVDVDVVVEA